MHLSQLPHSGRVEYSMDITPTLPILDAYASALLCLPAMGQGDLGSHWREWVSRMDEVQQAAPLDTTAMRPLTEDEEGWLWDAYHHTGALAHKKPRTDDFYFTSLFEKSLPWLLSHGKISWSRLATRWMDETPPPGPPTVGFYPDINTRTISKEEYVEGFHVRLGVDIACAGCGLESPHLATQRRALREQVLATMAHMPSQREWRSVVSPQAMWLWPELLSSPAYAYARTRPLNECLALGSGLSRGNLFYTLINNPEFIPDTPKHHMVITDLSPPSTLDVREWHDWTASAGRGWMEEDNLKDTSLPPALWDIIAERLLRHDPDTLLDSAHIVSGVLQFLTPPPAVCDAFSAWWDAHRDALRTQSALSVFQKSELHLGEVLLECRHLREMPDWATRYATADMTITQAENVLNALTPQLWSALETVFLEWARTRASDPNFGKALAILDDRVNGPITQAAQWMDVYLAQCSSGHPTGWFLTWVDHGQLPFTSLPPSLLARLLQAPDRQVREYAIRTMAHSRATQSPPALDSAPARPLLP